MMLAYKEVATTHTPELYWSRYIIVHGLAYQLGKKTVPLFGPIFAWEMRDMCFLRDRFNVHGPQAHGVYYRFMVCECAPWGKSVERIPMPEALSFWGAEDYARFWKDPASVIGKMITNAIPEGTILCSWVKPLYFLEV